MAVAKDADVSAYSPLQTKAAEVVGDAQKITQFLDRDTRPDFAGPNGMQGFLLSYLKNPKQDLAQAPGTDPEVLGRAPADGLVPTTAGHRLTFGHGHHERTTTTPAHPTTSPGEAGARRIRPARTPLQPADPAGQDRPRRSWSGSPSSSTSALVWGPTIASVCLSFTDWRGIQGLTPTTSSASRTTRRSSPLPVLLAGPQPQHPVAGRAPVRRHADRHLLRGPARPRDKRQPVLPEHLLYAGRPVAGHHRLHLAAPVRPGAGLHQQRPRPDRRRRRRAHRLAGRPEPRTSGPCSSPRAGATSATS